MLRIDFHFLNNRIAGQVFIKPDRLTFERYILPRAETTIVLSRITQPPQLTINGVPYPRLEKILVDVFADIELFYIFHGQELVHIFETAFERYLISEKALFRYAERRRSAKIREFIHKETQIQLLQERKEKQDICSTTVQKTGSSNSWLSQAPADLKFDRKDDS